MTCQKRRIVEVIILNLIIIRLLGNINTLRKYQNRKRLYLS